MPNPIVHWREILTLDWAQSPKPWILLPEGEHLPPVVLSVVWGAVSEEHGRSLECGMLVSSARASALAEKLELLDAINLCQDCLARRYCARLLQRADEFRRRTLLAGMTRPGTSAAWVGDHDRFMRFATAPTPVQPPPPPWRPADPWGPLGDNGRERYERIFRETVEDMYRQRPSGRALQIPGDDKELRKAAKTLGVTLPTTADAVQKAWKRQAKKHHPDKHPEREDGATEKMVAANVARDVLLRHLSTRI
jgi:hypothetical protein